MSAVDSKDMGGNPRPGKAMSRKRGGAMDSLVANNPDYSAMVKKLEQRLRLKSFPIALRLLESADDLGRIPFLRQPGRKVTFCQLINQARNFNLTVGAELNEFLFPTCPSILGLCEVPATHLDGSFRNIVWASTKEEAARYEASIARIPAGKFSAVALAPLVHGAFEPHMALIYANPAQVVLMINALQYKDYEVMEFFCVGESSCSDAIARCYLTGKPSLSLPCFGERRFGHVQDDEITLALPPELLPKMLTGLDMIYRRGVRYPIAYAGAEADFTPSWPAAYFALDDTMDALAAGGRRLLVGLAGSEPVVLQPVAQQFRALGAKVLDWADIEKSLLADGSETHDALLEQFGPEIAGPDGQVDQTKFNKAMAADPSGRKKAAGILAKGAFQELCRRVSDLTEEDPEAIILVIAPQIIKQNEMYKFDRIIVAQGANPGTRHGGAELFADHVLDTDSSLDILGKKVKAVWRELREFQQVSNARKVPADYFDTDGGSTEPVPGPTRLHFDENPLGGKTPWEADLGVSVALVKDAHYADGQVYLTLGAVQAENAAATAVQNLPADYSLEFAFASRASGSYQGWPRWTFGFSTEGLTGEGITEKMASIVKAHSIEMARLAVLDNPRGAKQPVRNFKQVVRQREAS